MSLIRRFYHLKAKSAFWSYYLVSSRTYSLPWSGSTDFKAHETCFRNRHHAALKCLESQIRIMFAGIIIFDQLWRREMKLLFKYYCIILNHIKMYHWNHASNDASADKNLVRMFLWRRLNLKSYIDDLEVIKFNVGFMFP